MVQISLNHTKTKTNGSFHRGYFQEAPVFYPAAYVMRCCDWSKLGRHLDIFYFSALFFCRRRFRCKQFANRAFWGIISSLSFFKIYNDILYSHFSPMRYYFHFKVDFCWSLSSSVTNCLAFLLKSTGSFIYMSYSIHCACSGSVTWPRDSNDSLKVPSHQAYNGVI